MTGGVLIPCGFSEDSEKGKQFSRIKSPRVAVCGGVEETIGMHSKRETMAFLRSWELFHGVTCLCRRTRAASGRRSRCGGRAHPRWASAPGPSRSSGPSFLAHCGGWTARTRGGADAGPRATRPCPRRERGSAPRLSPPPSCARTVGAGSQNDSGFAAC